MAGVFTGGFILRTYPWRPQFFSGYPGFTPTISATGYPHFETDNLDKIPNEVLDVIAVKEWTLTASATVDDFSKSFTETFPAFTGLYYDDTGGAADTGGVVENVGTAYATSQEQFDSYGFKDIPETHLVGASESSRGPLWCRFLGNEEISGYRYEYDWQIEMLRANPIIYMDGMDQVLAWSLFFSVSMNLTKTLLPLPNSPDYDETNRVITFGGETYDTQSLTNASPAFVSGFGCALSVDEYWTL